MKPRHTITGLAVLLLASGSVSSTPQNDIIYILPGEPRVLEGLPGIYLVVSVVGEEKHGLKAEAVRKDVELRLKQAKVRLFTDREMFKFRPVGAELPSLHVYINPNGPPDNPLVSVNLREDMMPTRNRKMVVLADAWRKEYYTWRDTSIIGVRDAAMSLVDWFCSDYVAGNSNKKK